MNYANQEMQCHHKKLSMSKKSLLEARIIQRYYEKNGQKPSEDKLKFMLEYVTKRLIEKHEHTKQEKKMTNEEDMEEVDDWVVINDSSQTMEDANQLFK